MKKNFFIVFIIFGINTTFPQLIKPLTLDSVVENCPNKKKIDSILVTGNHVKIDYFTTGFYY